MHRTQQGCSAVVICLQQDRRWVIRRSEEGFISHRLELTLTQGHVFSSADTEAKGSACISPAPSGFLAINLQCRLVSWREYAQCFLRWPFSVHGCSAVKWFGTTFSQHNMLDEVYQGLPGWQQKSIHFQKESFVPSMALQRQCALEVKPLWSQRPSRCSDLIQGEATCRTLAQIAGLVSVLKTFGHDEIGQSHSWYS